MADLGDPKPKKDFDALYEIVPGRPGFIASGNFGIVRRATTKDKKQTVAVKEPGVRLAANLSTRALSKRWVEAQIIYGLEHPNVIKVLLQINKILYIIFRD